MMKYRSPSISATTKPMNLQIDTVLRTWNSVPRRNMMTSQQIQYGRRPPYWKSSFGYISKIYCPINAKFCVRKQNHVTNIPIFANSSWWTAAILKKVLSHISAADHPISMKFGVPLHSLVPRMINNESTKILQIQNGGRPLCLWALLCRPADLVGALS